MHFRIDKGLDVSLGRVPGRVVSAAPPVRSVAVTTLDDPGMRARALVGVGERVRAGQALMEDRRRPAVRFTAPVAGLITEVRMGPRRRLEAVVLDVVDGDGDGDEAESFSVPSGEATPAAIREALQRSGLWATLRARPFGRIPDPDAEPAGVLVTAIDTRPLAPDPGVLVAERRDDFARGVRALTALTPGLVHACVAPGSEHVVPEHERVRCASFDGPHPAGLPGTHAHRLEPAGASREVWDVEAQDVLAMGRLLTTGALDGERVVSIAGPLVREPTLLRVPLGASVAELVAGRLIRADGARVIAGSALDGRVAIGSAAWLDRRHRQVTVVPEPARPARATGLVPSERQEDAFPFDIPVTSLLRALEVGDVDVAIELGALELLEEDVALLAVLSPSRLDHGARLREVLDLAAKEASVASASAAAEGADG